MRATRSAFCFAGLAVVVLFPARASAFGPQGHEAIGEMAKLYLSDKAKEGLKDLFDQVKSADPAIPAGEFEWNSLATWADRIKKEQPATASWHYVNIPLDKNDFNKERDGMNGDCIALQLPKFEKILADEKAEPLKRFEALRWIAHLMGDVHHPLHCAERDGDKGGNLVRVVLPDSKDPHNLHEVWDMVLVTRTLGEATAADSAAALKKETTGEEISEWKKGTFIEWVLESHALAKKSVYAADVPAGDKPVKLSKEYLDASAKITRIQMRKAGVRMATVVNRCFEKK